MNIVFEKMNEKHKKGIMTVFNYYVENSTSAFPSEALPDQFYAMLLKKLEGYPAYALIDTDKDTVVGFCKLSAYNTCPTFVKTACLTYFIAPEYTGKGLGSNCLSKLECDAKQMNIEHLISEISSENSGSISFHKNHGFTVAGELHNVGEKLNRKFGIVYMEKSI
ncbi:GNAT family N-acetyltransferase [Anaerosacchariphilus polymeriproducens]|uniref:GNAT family N-acetyltransferase n=1 Tax=Anaerosacchariphilus polymeriproducens TaxID=1812858 RepID=A0A371AX39_9FIRM|nr:GNAT family N-acetyltransferase [Anaerosacchariphilus polymeriproducens]RDU24137.1 GNAT family N-acetyltransferase [Anaerosacchariphilus polymeriproducens]